MDNFIFISPTYFYGKRLMNSDTNCASLRPTYFDRFAFEAIQRFTVIKAVQVNAQNLHLSVIYCLIIQIDRQAL